MSQMTGEKCFKSGLYRTECCDEEKFCKEGKIFGVCLGPDCPNHHRGRAKGPSSGGQFKYDPVKWILV